MSMNEQDRAAKTGEIEALIERANAAKQPHDRVLALSIYDHTMLATVEEGYFTATIKSLTKLVESREREG